MRYFDDMSPRSKYVSSRGHECSTSCTSMSPHLNSQFSSSERSDPVHYASHRVDQNLVDTSDPEEREELDAASAIYWRLLASRSGHSNEVPIDAEMKPVRCLLPEASERPSKRIKVILLPRSLHEIIDVHHIQTTPEEEEHNSTSSALFEYLQKSSYDRPRKSGSGHSASPEYQSRTGTKFKDSDVVQNHFPGQQDFLQKTNSHQTSYLATRISCRERSLESVNSQQGRPIDRQISLLTKLCLSRSKRC